MYRELKRYYHSQRDIAFIIRTGGLSGYKNKKNKICVVSSLQKNWSKDFFEKPKGNRRTEKKRRKNVAKSNYTLANLLGNFLKVL